MIEHSDQPEEVEHGVNLDAFLNNETGSNEFITAIGEEGEPAPEVEKTAAEEEEETPAAVVEEPKDEKQEKYSQALAKLNEQRQQLEKEKAEIATFRKAKTRLEQAGELFEEEPVEFARQFVGAFYETEDEDKIEQGIQHLYQALLAHTLGDGAPEALRPDKKTIKVERELRQLKKQLADKDREAERQALERQAWEHNQQIVSEITQAVQTYQSQLEYLAASGEDGIETVRIMVLNGEPFEQALLKVNGFYEKEVNEKYLPLLEKKLKPAEPTQDKSVKPKAKQPAKNLSNADVAGGSNRDSTSYEEDDWRTSAKLIRLQP